MDILHAFTEKKDGRLYEIVETMRGIDKANNLHANSYILIMRIERRIIII